MNPHGRWYLFGLMSGISLGCTFGLVLLTLVIGLQQAHEGGSSTVDIKPTQIVLLSAAALAALGGTLLKVRARRGVAEAAA